MDALFLPGWGAPASLYEPVLPEAWTALEPPSFATTGGALAAYHAWLGAELSTRSLHRRRPLHGRSARAARRFDRA